MSEYGLAVADTNDWEYVINYSRKRKDTTVNSLAEVVGFMFWLDPAILEKEPRYFLDDERDRATLEAVRNGILKHSQKP